MADWSVRVPASSANLGPAFDAAAVALATHLVITPSEGGGEAESHPAVRAFRSEGGRGRIRVRSSFPGGRGLGFSGAARAGGVVAAWRQQGRWVPADRLGAVASAAALEGHADNVAASIVGGIVVVAAGRVVRVPRGVTPAVVVWTPAAETSTAASRRRLPATVPFADAVANVGRAALLVAALAAGDVESLRAATHDRLHQDARLAAVPEARTAMASALDAGAWCAWLSGSGPSVAAFSAPEAAAAIAAALPGAGRAMVVAIDDEGTVVT